VLDKERSLDWRGDSRFPIIPSFPLSEELLLAESLYLLQQVTVTGPVSNCLDFRNFSTAF
jgi:hypothetical protein